MDSKSLSHARWKCQYHILYIPKYRKRKLFRQLRLDVREDIRYTVQIQGSRNYGRCSVCRLHAYVRKYPAEDKYFKFYGVPEGEKYTDDI